MIAAIWHDYLFAPLLNLLIYFYNTIAFGNLGFAVIYMTIGLRIFLIPFSIIAERNGFKYEKIQADVSEIQKEFKDDPVARKEHIRELMRANRIQPLASVVLTGIQLLTLVLLYQVFVGGMTGKLAALYPAVARPDVINTNLFGLDIAQRNMYAAGLVGALLYWQIWRSQRKRRETLEKNDIIFRYAFPLITFAVLASLPSVKVIFILTAMGFGYIIHLCRPFFTRRLQTVKLTALKIHDKIVGGEKVNSLDSHG
ncbi:YidC/Oxa1 family membrane protein insertase [Candidatus Uhrbacteria bacterium]|nr:YidC/Oxa1 family membrane protein insertase [Candidatus Uhrbacteria bacterium]